jgi:hypothetical protein
LAKLCDCSSDITELADKIYRDLQNFSLFEKNNIFKTTGIVTVAGIDYIGFSIPDPAVILGYGDTVAESENTKCHRSNAWVELSKINII